MQKMSEETKQKIANSMKKAHAEHRAHNIGQSRWNNKPSYPEQWFMQVIENEFVDKKYVREFPFYKYSLDFAWPHKKICLEIDGEQHYRQTEAGMKQHQRDLEKDKLLAANGWQEIRIAWKAILAAPKEFINFFKAVVDDAEIKDIHNELWYQKGITNDNPVCPECGKPVKTDGHLCRKCAGIKHRVAARPEKKLLAEQLYKANLSAVSKLYGVSITTIVKWCKSYGLPTHIADLRNWYRVTVLKLPALEHKVKKAVKESYLVQQCDLATGKPIAEYSSFTEAALKTGIIADNIARACKGLRKSAGGYLWKKTNIAP